MSEDFLQYLWKHKKFRIRGLQTLSGKSIEVLSAGTHNHHSGPDFFNAKVRIAEQLWAGNIELHLKSSDWYSHHHQTDPNYDNVVLHVVWEYDAAVFRSNSSTIETLELRRFVDPRMLHNYHQLFANKQSWIPCERDIDSVNDFSIQHWLEKLYIERLAQRSEVIGVLLKDSNNHWESVLFKLLAKSFGLKVNGEALLRLANSFDLSVLRKVAGNVTQLEALLLGQAGLLETQLEEAYLLRLQREYGFLQKKFRLTKASVVPKFGRLRPANFPTVRLAQLAALYHQRTHLFSELMKAEKVSDFYQFFKVTASSYWDTHYTFGVVSRKRRKQLSDSFIDLLLINSVIPLKFCYAQSKSKDINESLLDLMMRLPKEKNSVVQKFETIGLQVEHALHSQALLQLKGSYCDLKKCLQCDVGNHLLNRN